MDVWTGSQGGVNGMGMSLWLEGLHYTSTLNTIVHKAIVEWSIISRDCLERKEGREGKRKEQ